MTMNAARRGAAITLLLWSAAGGAQGNGSGVPRSASPPHATTSASVGQAPVVLSPVPVHETPRQVIHTATAQQDSRVTLTLAGPGPALRVLHWPAHLPVRSLRGQWMTLHTAQRPDGAPTIIRFRSRLNGHASLTLLFGLRPAETFEDLPVRLTAVGADQAVLQWGARTWLLRPSQRAAGQVAGRRVNVTLEAIQPVTADDVERGRPPVITGYRAFLSIRISP